MVTPRIKLFYMLLMFCRTRRATPFESRWSWPLLQFFRSHTTFFSTRSHRHPPPPSAALSEPFWWPEPFSSLAISQNRHRSPVFGELRPRTCFLPYFWIEPHLISLPHLRSIRCITGISTTTTGAPHHRQGSPPLSLHCCPVATVSPRRRNFALCIPLATSMLTPPVGLHLVHR
jgi:hypothetical protein